MADSRLERIERGLRDALEPSELRVEDESAQHRGHAGAADGRGHFRVWIVSARFVGCARLQRHRMVYDALAEELQTEIHALAIHAFTLEEWVQRV